MTTNRCPDCDRPIMLKSIRCRACAARALVASKGAKVVDPTPEEIAERAAFFRERHLARMRGMVGVPNENSRFSR